MDLKTIAATYFGTIHERSGIPLFQRLEKALNTFLEAQEDYTLLPPERELADAIGVNRRTLSKAMAGLVAEGKLERSKKGTVVRKQNRKDETDRFTIQNVHPLLWNMAPPRQPLRILLFDNLPEQVTFWNECAGRFFDEFHLPVELEWLPLEQNPYEYACSGRYDLMETASYSLQTSERFAAFADIFPEELVRELSGPDYRIRHFLQGEEILRNRMAPIYVQYWCRNVNRTLAEDFSVDLRAVEHGESSFFDLIRQASRNLPEDIFISDHVNSLGLGIERPLEYRESNMRDYFQQYFSICNAAAARGCEAFLMDVEEPYHLYQKDTIAAFANGHLFHIAGHSALLNTFRREKKVPVSNFLAYAAGDGRINMPASGLSVPVTSHRKEEAIQFIRHVLSDEMQTRMAECVAVAPMRLSSDRGLRDHLVGEMSFLSGVLNRYQCSPATIFSNGKCWDVQKIIRGMLEKKFSISSAVDLAVELFFKQYQSSQ